MKTILTLVAVLFTTVAMSQPPMQRPLPNQFRDYVDFRQAQQRPKVEHKDGKVIITMTEQQFRMMQQRRRQQAVRNFRNTRLVCNCQKMMPPHRAISRY
jgi:hypothetical protein